MFKLSHKHFSCNKDNDNTLDYINKFDRNIGYTVHNVSTCSQICKEERRERNHKWVVACKNAYKNTVKAVTRL